MNRSSLDGRCMSRGTQGQRGNTVKLARINIQPTARCGEAGHCCVGMDSTLRG